MKQPLIDIHQHVVFGMDDGAQSIEDTQKMLDASIEQGITAVVATSHACPGRDVFDRQAYMERLNVINERLDKQGAKLRLYPGAEIMYTGDTVHALNEGMVPTLCNTAMVLIEFLPSAPYDYLYQALRSLLNNGYRPILAHFERYECLYRRPERIDELRNAGVYLQMNCHTVLASKSIFQGRPIHHLLANGSVDMVASDAHNVQSRPVCMKRCYELLAKKYGSDVADSMCGGLQAELLGV